MSRNDREDAMQVFMTGEFSQKDIARFFDRTEATISRWAKEDEWDKKLMDKMSSDNEINENAWKAIRYTVKLMARHVDENTEKETWKPIDPALTNSLSQIMKSAKPKGVKLVTMLDWTRDLLTVVREYDNELAKKLMPIIDDFINRKRKELANDKG